MSSPSTITHTVPGSFAGTVYQLERALLHLADGSLTPDAQVGIETDDDVAVRLSDEGGIREQDKHSLDRQPFSDGSENLWKTILIWLTALAEGAFLLDQTRLFLVTNQRVQDDCLAMRISRAREDEDLQGCLREVRKFATAAKRRRLAIAAEVAKVLDHGEERLLGLFRVCRPAQIG